MRFQDLIQGEFYELTSTPSSSFKLEAGPSVVVRKGYVFLCEEIKKRNTDRWSACGTQSSVMRLYSNGKQTNTTFRFNHHGCLKKVVRPPTMDNRGWERKELEAKLENWQLELEDAQERVEQLEEQIREGRTRLANLQSFESDTAALAHVLEEKLGTKLSDKEISDLVREAGIGLS